ncbi:flowering time control protein FCA, partial [Fagus crenata]
VRVSVNSKFAKLDRHRGDRYNTTTTATTNNNNHYNDSQPYRHSRAPSRFSDAPLNNNHNRRSPNNFRGGANHCPFESPPRHSQSDSGERSEPEASGA